VRDDSPIEMLQPDEVSEIEQVLRNYEIDDEWKLISCVAERIRQLTAVTQGNTFLTDSKYAWEVRRTLHAYAEIAGYLSEVVHGRITPAEFHSDPFRHQVYQILERTGILERIIPK
jgi:hypothetical protein